MIYWLSILFGLIFLTLSINAVRRGLLQFSYAFLWVTLAVGILILPLVTPIVDKIAHALGVSYAPALLFLAGTLFIIVYVFYLTLTVSKLVRVTARLTQELGIARQRIEELEGNKRG